MEKTIRSILRQVQSSSDDHRSNLSPTTTSNNEAIPILDLNSAIEYNYCLINSYVQERNQRTLSPYDEIAKTLTSAQDEDAIIDSICPEFFTDPTVKTDTSSLCDENNNNNDNLSEREQFDLAASSIMEQCVLAKLPPLENTEELLGYLEKERKKLERQQTIVSKRLTHLILMNDGPFQSELSRVRSIEQELNSAINTCINVRRAFGESKRDFTETSMTIIDKHRKRKAIVKIMDCLQMIKQLRQTIERIGYMLEYEKNFATAIDLLDEQLERIESLAENYQCVAEMRDRLSNCIQLMGNQMDAVLVKMCDRFDLKTYRQLTKAYAQIDKTEDSLQQLQLNFANAIHDKSFSIVHGYVKLFSPEHHHPGNQNESSFKRKTFDELCQHLNPESFLQCLIDLCRSLWDIMYNYHRCLCFYQRQKCEQREQQSPLTKEQLDLAVKKLSYGIHRIWSDIQFKIRTLLSSVRFVQQQQIVDEISQLNNDNDEIIANDHHQDQLLFNFEEFIKILTVAERMIEIGEQFNNCCDDEIPKTNSPTIELQNTLLQQTKAYIQSYHQVSMVELKIFLENEIWTRCPIETTNEFKLIANLQEFSFIKQRLLRINNNNDDVISSPDKNLKHQPSTLLLSPINSTTNSRRYFIDCDDDDIDGIDDELSTIISPFDELVLNNDKLLQKTLCDQNESNLDCSDNDDIINNDKSSSEIVTTNTALNLVRLMGRYMNIMYLLRPISHDIIQALLELFDYYLYAIYHFFAEDSLSISWLAHTLVSNQQQQQQQISSSIINSKFQLNNKLSSFIKRINDTLIQNEDSPISLSSSSSSSDTSSAHSSPSKAKWKRPKYPCPTLPDYVPLQSADHYYALGERIMAIQSIIFIGRQFYHLCPFLLEFLRPNSSDDECDGIEQQSKSEDGFKALQFYHDKLCSSVASLQYQCLYAVATKLLPFETIVQQMQQNRWDLKDIPSIHSSYVNVFINELNRFDVALRQLLVSHDLTFLLNNPDDDNDIDDSITNDMPLTKLECLSQRIPMTVWECLLRASNRTFIEGFSAARKCSNEGRALMQLDYEQFISHIEKLMTPYYKRRQTKNNLKSYLANERLQVEEFIKAFYINESTFIDWIRQKPNAYTGKQIVSLIGCIAADNKKLRTNLLSAIGSSSLDQQSMTSNDVIQ